jgi:hypothetical protein
MIASVTRILEVVGIKPDIQLSEEQKQYYMLRGQYIHEATELVDAGTLDRSSLSPALEPFVTCYDMFRNEAGGEILLSEAWLESEEYGYGGKIDRLLRNVKREKLCEHCTNTLCRVSKKMKKCNTDIVLIDFKPTRPYENAPLQSAAYAILIADQVLNEKKNVSLLQRYETLCRGSISLNLKDDGTWKFYAYRDPQDFVDWWQALEWFKIILRRRPSLAKQFEYIEQKRKEEKK